MRLAGVDRGHQLARCVHVAQAQDVDQDEVEAVMTGAMKTATANMKAEEDVDDGAADVEKKTVSITESLRFSL